MNPAVKKRYISYIFFVIKSMDVTKEMYCICINKYLMEIQIDCYSLGSSYYHDYDEIKQNQAWPVFDQSIGLVQFGSGYWEEDQNVKSKRTPDAQSCHGKSSPQLSTLVI